MQFGRKQRIFLASDSDTAKQLKKVISRVDPNAKVEIKPNGKTVSVYLRNGKYAELLSHIDGTIKRGLVMVDRVSVTASEWTLDNWAVLERRGA